MARAKSKAEETVDYVALIERQSLHYGVSHHYPKWSAARPYSRSLYLHGRWAHPLKSRGVICEVFLFGDPALPEAPDELPKKTVASAHKNGDRLAVTAGVPPEFVATLSAAFNDGRLHIFNGRGSPLKRNAALLISLSFSDRASFEDDWGEPLL